MSQPWRPSSRGSLLSSPPSCPSWRLARPTDPLHASRPSPVHRAAASPRPLPRRAPPPPCWCPPRPVQAARCALGVQRARAIALHAQGHTHQPRRPRRARGEPAVSPSRASSRRWAGARCC
eukprot:Mycagemm_TRINITY_DN8424_c0_g1::TRINITY_DN8424_c0_g1_i1::g.4637::m.4637 type:complete len:121 gc:universal TRINITY_DN8424_c0_g1_i1:435-73(-)